MKEMGRHEWLKRKTRLLTELSTTTMIMMGGVVIIVWDSATTIHPGGTGMPRSPTRTILAGRAMDIPTLSTDLVEITMGTAPIPMAGTTDTTVRTDITVVILTWSTVLRVHVRSRQEIRVIGGLGMDVLVVLLEGQHPHWA